jgi:hypothetical protein
MKAGLTLIITVVLSVLSCSIQAQDAPSKAKVLKLKVIAAPATEAALLRTNIIEPKYSKGKLSFKGKYGGGCKEHAFEVQSTGKLDEQGVLHLYLIDRTTDDFCKAFKFVDLIVDVKSVFKKLPKSFKLQINQSEITSINR